MKIKLILASIYVLCYTTVISQKATITVDVKNAKSDRMAWMLMPMNILEPSKSLTVPQDKTTFHQQLAISEITYVSISDGVNYVGGFIEPGDSVFIKYDALRRTESLNFSGVGSNKFHISNSVENMVLKTKSEKDIAKNQAFPLDYFLSKVDSIENIERQSIERIKGSLTNKAYLQLSAYLKASTLRSKYNGVIGIFGDSFDKILSSNNERLSEKSKGNMRSLLKFDERLAESPFYTNMVQNILSLYLDENTPSHSTEAKYSTLARYLPEKLRSTVLYLAVKEEIQQNTNVSLDTIVATAFRLPTDSMFVMSLKHQFLAAHELKPGMQAPNFSIETLDGNKVTLSSLMGKTVYLDFWFAGCAPCHQLFRDISPIKKYFKNDPNVVFLVVSVDEKETWRRALNRFQIGGIHAFTENKLRNHSILEAYNVSAYPSTFIIDGTGKFFSVNPSKDPETLKAQLLSASKQTAQK